MIENYYLPGLYGKSKPMSALIKDINRLETPHLYLFLTDTNAFYQKYCLCIETYKIREKRLLDFETPNRVKITHEYDIQIDDSFNFKNSYYLFNPINRLSWLKISQESSRLTIVGEKDVKKIIEDILHEELLGLNIPFDEVWSQKEGLPCFIKLLDTEKHNFLLFAEYYDSIKKSETDNSIIRGIKFLINILLPLNERRIRYDYLPSPGKSSWLYLRAPKNFNLKINNVANNTTENDVSMSYTGENEADPEIKSLTILNKNTISRKRDNVIFYIKILVPNSLKCWFMVIYYVSFFVLFLLLYFFLSTYNYKFIVHDPFYEFLKKGTLGNVVMGLVAAIIATRGWLISEETILKRYSKLITFLAIAIGFLYSLCLLS